MTNWWIYNLLQRIQIWAVVVLGIVTHWYSRIIGSYFVEDIFGDQICWLLMVVGCILHMIFGLLDLVVSMTNTWIDDHH